MWPSPQVYQLALDRLGVTHREISFQSSNRWDVYAASAFGFCTVWCNRTGQPREQLPGAPDLELATLAALPDHLGAERAV